MSEERNTLPAGVRGLYRVAAVAAFLFVAMVMAPFALMGAFPQPPLSGGAAVLEYIASHRAVYLIELVCFVGLGLPAMVVFLALYMALKEVNRGFAALGAVAGIASETMALALGGSPPSLSFPLVLLSDQYARAAADLRPALASAADGLAASANAVNAVGVVTALGILVLSLVMLKGVFHKAVAILGIAAGASGIVCEILRDDIGMVYAVYGVLLVAWFVAVGWKMRRL